MKKLFVLIAALIVVAACTAPPANRETVNRSTVAEKPSAPPITEADAIAKEKAVWDSVKNKDYDAFAGALDSGSLEVTADGVLEKSGSVSMVKDFEPTEITFSDWKFLSIDKDAFVVTYTVVAKGKYKGKEIPPTPVRGSSAWANRNGKWLAVYHQETDVEKTPPPPPPAAKAKPGATPASTPAQATATSDVIANEKMIWAFLKAGQYDSFAAMLAPDSIEVEANGVFDKAGTLKGVQGFDFSKSTVSEFKSLSIDSDAALVTYLLTTPGAKHVEERHTTIWAMRSGKWMAVFHHGTPAAHAMSSASPMTHPMNSGSPMTHSMTSPSPK
ncbi:MAG TPA: nuclear transport factor 2 family protein [Pyrinomonadaceae bacterium]